MEFEVKLKKDEKEGTASMELTVPYGELGAYLDRTAAVHAREGEVPGFRKGKAPRPRIIAHFGEDTIRDFAMRLLACEAFLEAIEKEEVAASGKVHFDLSPIEAEKPLMFTAGFQVGEAPEDEPELPWPRVGDADLDADDRPYGPAPDYLRRGRK